MAPPVKFNRSFSISLDLIRALSAIAVLIGHAAQNQLYTGPYPFTIALQCNAVIVFFVLSGLVIANSVAGGKGTLTEYAIARASRILPVAWPTIGLALLAAAIAGGSGAPAAPDATPLDIARATLFLSESYGRHFLANLPYWSLCYEVWYYALFGVAMYLRGGKRWFWLALLAAIAGPRVLLMLPAWLAGVLLVRCLGSERLPALTAWIHVAVAFATLGMLSHLFAPGRDPDVPLQFWLAGQLLSFLTDTALALAVALGIRGLHSLLAGEVKLLLRIEAPVRLLANMSFSLYLLHYPLIRLLGAAGVRQIESPLACAGVLAAIMAVCYGFATVTEHKRPQVRALLQALLQRPRAAAA